MKSLDRRVRKQIRSKLENALADWYAQISPKRDTAKGLDNIYTLFSITADDPSFSSPMTKAHVTAIWFQ